MDNIKISEYDINWCINNVQYKYDIKTISKSIIMNQIMYYCLLCP